MNLSMNGRIDLVPNKEQLVYLIDLILGLNLNMRKPIVLEPELTWQRMVK